MLSVDHYAHLVNQGKTLGKWFRENLSAEKFSPINSYKVL